MEDYVAKKLFGESLDNTLGVDLVDGSVIFGQLCCQGSNLLNQPRPRLGMYEK